VEFHVILLDKAGEFIHNLPAKLEAKSLRSVTMLQQFGYTLREPHSKLLKGVEGLKELRVQVGTDICRLFYFHFKDTIYVVTSGYVKKEQKTNREEIERALRIKNDFLKERNSENH
jgi:phage-related protein